MKYEALERDLIKRTKHRRFIETVFLLIFTIIITVFSALREASKEITVIDIGFISHETVRYNSRGTWGINLFFNSFIRPYLLQMCKPWHRYSPHHRIQKFDTMYGLRRRRRKRRLRLFILLPRCGNKTWRRNKNYSFFFERRIIYSSHIIFR